MKQKKTGPISDEGKARSSMNATKHGLGSQSICLSHENIHEYKSHHDRVYEAFPVKVPAQAFVVESLVRDMWLLQRNNRIMSQMINAERNKPITCLEIEHQIGNIKMNGKPIFDIMKMSEVYEKEDVVLNFEQSQRVIEGVRLWRLRQVGQVVSWEQILTYLSPDQRTMVSSLSPEYIRRIDAQMNGFERDALRFMNENPKAGWIVSAIEAIQAKRIMTIQVNQDYQRYITRLERSIERQQSHYKELNEGYIDGLKDVAFDRPLSVNAQDVVLR